MQGPLWLEPGDPPDRFPDPELALEEPDGLLAVGGDLSDARLLEAYRRGIFPWYQDQQPILWWSPAIRGVLFPSDLHVSRSLHRTLRRNRFEFSFDGDFDAVIAGCARAREETWITPAMILAYTSLHEAGHAHSIEIWADGDLAGGLYGVNVGRIFFGESMFSGHTDASKVAIVALVARCRDLGIAMIDCQLPTPHLSRLGVRQLSRSVFLQQVSRHAAFGAPSGWAQARQPCAVLLG